MDVRELKMFLPELTLVALLLKSVNRMYILERARVLLYPLEVIVVRLEDGVYFLQDVYMKDTGKCPVDTMRETIGFVVPSFQERLASCHTLKDMRACLLDYLIENTWILRRIHSTKDPKIATDLAWALVLQNSKDNTLVIHQVGFQREWEVCGDGNPLPSYMSF